MISISNGNKKLSGNKFYIFNLPAEKTCPGSTEFCRNKCYAKKAEKIYPSVLPCRMNNLNESKEKDFSSKVINFLNKNKKREFFRIHEAGDFYDQNYLNKWIEITNNFPEIKFLAFTKSFNLDFSNVPKNLQLVMSIMPDTTKEAPKKFPTAYAGNCKGMNKEKTLECPGSCTNCGMCWDLSKTKLNVHFNIH
jgi:hypothetical protein